MTQTVYYCATEEPKSPFISGDKLAVIVSVQDLGPIEKGSTIRNYELVLDNWIDASEFIKTELIDEQKVTDALTMVEAYEAARAFAGE